MNPRVVSAATSATGHQAACELSDTLKAAANGQRVRGLFLYASVHQEAASLAAQLSTELDGAHVLGCTSCLGVGSDDTFLDGAGAAVLALAGDGFRFATTHLERGQSSAEELGRQLAIRALASAGLAASEARFAVLHCTPGDEERILRGAYGVLDTKMPMVGGSAADNDLSAEWRVFTHEGEASNGASLAVCDWPWKLATAYESGYLVAKLQGVATRVDGRILHEIDGKPAAEVYNGWTRGSIADALTNGGQVLGATTLAPLGVLRASVADMPFYLLVHPESVSLPGRGLSLFAEIREGEQITLMQSTHGALVHRASRLADRALRDADFYPNQVLGSLLIYCGGCLLAVSDKAGEIMRDFSTCLNAPTVAAFTFGEVGCVVPRRVDHGNLMAGILLLTGETES